MWLFLIISFPFQKLKKKKQSFKAKGRGFKVAIILQEAEKAKINNTIKNNTFLLSCGSFDSKFRNDKTLRDLIDNFNVCDKNSQLNECMTEHKWNKHPK